MPSEPEAPPKSADAAGRLRDEPHKISAQKRADEFFI
jgi:hypothetical protein